MALIRRRLHCDSTQNEWDSAADLTPGDSLEGRSVSRYWPIGRSDVEGLGTGTGPATPLDSILAEFSSRWERGEEPSIEEYLPRLGPAPTSDAAMLIYHAFCLAEATGRNPDPADFLERFPTQGPSLARLFSVHHLLDPAQFSRWADPGMLPEPGDEIGPFRLLRELGRGGLARVFLAEQSDLDDRLVVVKVSARITPEPRLLARARHSHIVELLWHSLSDDGALQVVCMPFLGGATLADVLSERRRRGGRPRSGRDLLAELDRVAAPEYPPADLARPAREVLAGLSYPQAVAWLVARLAEALDYAYSRGVLHGDVKPSNILLTAAGEPMLLDFNLAVGWRLPRAGDLPGDVGGTLAYMAPERLRAVAQPEPSAPGRAADRHRADLYALGIVLLETLTGWTPDLERGLPRRPRETAAALARARQQGAGALIRACPVSIAPGLRSIVTRCLAPDPADRYNRASELAEDLDRWRSDRPLAFAREPDRRAGVLRWMRKRRRAIFAGILSLVVATVSTLAVSKAFHSSLRESALSRLARLWDDPEARVFRYQKSGRWRTVDRDAPEDAFRHLAYYNVLGSGDWRESHAFSALPDADRASLELWILGQTLRLGRALGSRTDSPGDWRRGLEALDRVVALRPAGPLLVQRRVLRRQLGLPDSETGHASSADTAREAGLVPRWMEEYLLGVEAEPLRAEDALVHFQNVLRERPEEFWGHYGVASAAYRLSDPATATAHLEYCIARRPENATLRTKFAGRLYDMLRLDEALEQCNKALILDPDDAESYRTRTFLWNRLGQEERFRSDIERYELLTRNLGKLPAWRLRLDWMRLKSPDGAEVLDRDPTARSFYQNVLTADPEDVDLRYAQAVQLQNRGDLQAALDLYNRILEIEPDHLKARYARGTLLFKRHEGAAAGDFSYVLENPRYDALVRESRAILEAFDCDAAELVQIGATDKALQVASRGLAYARRFHDQPLEGRLHYTLARAYAIAARSASEQLQQAATHLHLASDYRREFLGPEGFLNDLSFDGQREQIAQLLPHRPADRD